MNTTINPPDTSSRNPPPSWATYFSNAASSGISNTYSFLKNQVTYPLTPVDPKRISLPSKEEKPSFLSSIRRSVSSITTRQCSTAVALVAIGYAYYQMPTFDALAGRAFDYVEDHSSHKPAPKENSYDLLHIALGGVVAIQSLVPLVKEDPLPGLFQQIGILHQETQAVIGNAAQTRADTIVAILGEQHRAHLEHMALIARAIGNFNTDQRGIDQFLQALKAVVFDNSATTTVQFSKLLVYLRGQPQVIRQLLNEATEAQRPPNLAYPATPPTEHTSASSPQKI